jgi:hypothetical protein
MPNADTRRRTLGTLWVIYGVICIIKLAWLVVNSTVLTLMWGALLNRVPDPFTWMSLFHFAMFGFDILLGVTALVSFLAAGSLFVGSNSSRSLALLAGFLGIVTGPVGIALGVYTWILFVGRSADGYQVPASA